MQDPQQPVQQSVVNLEVVNSDHAETSTSISDSQQIREDITIHNSSHVQSMLKLSIAM